MASQRSSSGGHGKQRGAAGPLAAVEAADSPVADFDDGQTPGGTAGMSIDGSAMFNEDTQLTDAYEELHNLSRTIPERSRTGQAALEPTPELDDGDLGELPPDEPVQTNGQAGPGADAAGGLAVATAATAATAAEDSSVVPNGTGGSAQGEAAAAAAASAGAVATPAAAAAASQLHDASSTDDEEIIDWAKHDKHVFILSNAGKPIYTRHGNEDKLATIMGVMQALISFVEEDNDQLRWFAAGEHKFVFLKRDPLLLVTVAKTNEPYPHLAVQLNYLYNLIISVLTLKQLQRIFEQRPNYDLRRMLIGTEKTADALVDLMDRDPSFFLSAVRCLRMPLQHREKIGQVLQANRCEDLLFAILVADNQLVSVLRRKRQSLLPQDVLLIMNLVSSSTAFKNAETWTPLCLPKFNDTGFLHAHISYVDEAASTCLLLLSTNRDAFYALSNARNSIVQSMAAQGCLEQIAAALKRRKDQISSLGIPELRHFLYKNKATAQFTSAPIEVPYTLPGQQQRLLRQYQEIHHCMHSTARPLKIMFKAGPNETMLGWITSGFELYAAFGPLVTKNGAINAVLDLIRWMKKEESALFISNPQTF